MDWSIILPSRRPHLLRRLLESLAGTVAHEYRR